MGSTHVSLTSMEVNDLIVPLPLVGGIPQQRNLAGGLSDVIAEVWEPSARHNHPKGSSRYIHIEGEPILACLGHLSTHV